MGWTTGVRFTAGAGRDSFFAIAFKPARGPNQPPNQ